MRVRSLSLALVICAAASTALAQDAAPAPPPMDAPAASASDSGLDVMGIKKYKLGPGDQLDLRVFNEPQFNGTLVVTDEGNIEIPFIDQPIPALCRNDREIKADVVKALEKFLNKPQVSLRVTAMRSRPPAVVFGAVRQPSRVQMHRRARLLELLATSGGVTESAGGDIQIFHTEPIMCPEPEDEIAKPVLSLEPTDPTQIAYDVYNLNDLRLGKDEANPIVRPGDIVIVQEAKPVYITGNVVHPQGIHLRDTTRMLSQAIAQVGGLRGQAKSNAIIIFRRKEGEPNAEKIIVNYKDIRDGKAKDIALQPYDIIEVPDASGNVTNTLKNLMMGTVRGGMSTFSTTVVPRVLY
ncbi:MAG: polysaccharide biosynthesis/export family protein [Acidobacteriota bacterium]|nr:polysaccharide biosynthesis/export family protein [Acidobacteriota bacterium]